MCVCVTIIIILSVGCFALSKSLHHGWDFITVNQYPILAISRSMHPCCHNVAKLTQVPVSPG